MKDTIQVLEFDSISSVSAEGFVSINEDAFSDLLEFIKTYDVSGQEDSDTDEFFKIGYRKGVGDTISVRNYVGLIQTKSGTQIEVLPKIILDDEDSKDFKQTKYIFSKMIRTLKDFPSKVFDNAHLKAERMNLYEIFINMYLGEVKELVKKGLRSNYETIEENLSYYKGKLNLKEHIKKNVTHQEKFFVKYDKFSPNRAENRLIKTTLLKLLGITKSQWNAKEIKQLLYYFELVDTANVEADLTKISVDRNMKEYQTIMRWTKVFLKNNSFTTFSGTTRARSLLFPMEKVFESYIAKHIKQTFIVERCNVLTQDSTHSLFNEPERFKLRPDIVLNFENGSNIIMDTKWKRLSDNPNNNYGISQIDMYQMYAYAKKYKASDVWLIYPKNNQLKNQKTLYFTSFDEPNITINVFFADLENIESSMAELKAKVLY